jgi:hypothetical protein
MFVGWMAAGDIGKNNFHGRQDFSDYATTIYQHTKPASLCGTMAGGLPSLLEVLKTRYKYERKAIPTVIL